MELILKNIYRSAQSKGERQEKYKRTLEIIFNLVNKIRDGSIDDINNLSRGL